VISASHTEGAQLGLLEPLGMGTPAVATAVGDAPDYLPGPLSAMLAPAGRPDLLGAALERLLAGYDEWQPRFAAQAGALRAAHTEEGAEAAMWAAFD
jgi:glycosyltransferase involved in cell wall biosynthesis